MAVGAITNEFWVSANGGGASVAGHDDGSFFVSWTANVAGGFYTEILGRAFDLNVALGAPAVVNTELRDAQFGSQVVALSDGSYAVAYSSGVEDSLPGTFLASQRVSNGGLKLGSEVFSLDYSYYHSGADGAALSGGRYVVVSSEEFDAEGDIRDSAGSISGGFDFSYSSTPIETAVTALGGNDFLVVWQGYLNELEASEDGPYGLYVQRRSSSGTAEAPVLVQPFAPQGSVDVVARTLGDGSVVLAWTLAGDIHAQIVDPATGATLVPAFVVNAAVAGDQVQPNLAVLDDGNFVVTWEDRRAALDDSSGSAVRARVFDGDGNAQGDALLVAQDVVGDQRAPSVASLGEGRFVITWNDGDGVQARLFDDQVAPTSMLYVRPGTQDGTAAADQELTSPAFASSFYFDLAATTGHDQVHNLGRHDVVLTSATLADPDADGIISLGAGGLLDLPGAGDDVLIDGVSALRYLGQDADVFVYADASVRPAGAKEGRTGNDVLSSDKPDAVGDIFFIDTALGAPTGADVIKNFGGKDVLVTTTKIADGNNDGIITFGSDKILDLSSGTVRLAGVNGKTINKLEYDGVVTHDGVNYYVYSQVGSAAGTASLNYEQTALYFTASGPGGAELYRYTANSATPVLVDVTPGEDSSLPNHLFGFAGDLYFTAFSPTGSQLYRLADGAASATPLNVPVNADLGLHVAGAALDGALYVSGFNDAVGGELFKVLSTGPGAPIEAVAGPVGLDPNVPFAFGGALYFDGFTADGGNELYRYSPATGLYTLIELQPGDVGSDPGDFVVFDGALYFTASSPENGTQIHRLEAGSETPEEIVLPGEPGAFGLTVVGDQLYFSAEIAGFGREIVSLTADGDWSVAADVNPGAGGSAPSQLTAFSDDLIFVADIAGQGRELVRYDPTSDSLDVFDLNAGAAGSDASDFTVLNGALYFTAVSAAAGRELYRWVGGDTTPTLIDATAGAASTFGEAPENGRSIVEMGGDVYFSSGDSLFRLASGASTATMVPFGGSSLSGLGELFVV